MSTNGIKLLKDIKGDKQITAMSGGSDLWSYAQMSLQIIQLST